MISLHPSFKIFVGIPLSFNLYFRLTNLIVGNRERLSAKFDPTNCFKLKEYNLKT